MKKTKRRLDKKRHKYWLEYGVIDLSQRSEWRRRLFGAEEGEIFRISADELGERDAKLAAIMRKYRLRFSVCVAEPPLAEAWLGDDGMVVFKFWADDYPELKRFSGNNPDVI